jgi:hypothetical protein
MLPQLQKLASQDQKAFFALRNNYKDTMRPIEGIVRTNAMPLGKDSPLAGVFPTCSRFNHSCVANAAYSWNDDKKKERVHAIRSISAGEEIVVSYLPDTMWTLPRGERKKQIQMRFSFDCQCIPCRDDANPNNNQTQSDQRRTRLAQIHQDIGNGVLIMTNPGKALASCREAITLLQEEEPGCPMAETVYYDAFQICICHGDLARASAFASLAADAKRLWQGPDASGLGEYEAYVRKPESHRLAFQSRKWFTAAGKAGAKAPSPPPPYTDEWLWCRAG